MSYDPRSSDSMFTRIMERLDQQDEVLVRIEQQTTRTNGRVTRLEQFNTALKSKVGIVSGTITLAGVVIGWLIEHHEKVAQVIR